MIKIKVTKITCKNDQLRYLTKCLMYSIVLLSNLSFIVSTKRDRLRRKAVYFSKKHNLKLLYVDNLEKSTNHFDFLVKVPSIP